MSALSRSNVVINTQQGPILVPWVQYVGRGPHPDERAFGPEECHAVMVFLINEDDEADFVEQVLGYPTITSQNTISRTLPIQHPRYPRMWAQKITSIRPIVPEGKDAGTNGLIPTTDYAYEFVTVLFKQPPYPVLTDAQLASIYGANAPEYYRFSWVEWDTTLDTLELPDSYLQWAETSATGPKIGQQIAAPQTLRLPYRTLTLHWYQVPYFYLLNSAGQPSNLNAAEGCVNLNSFLGLPAQTVYMQPAKKKRVEWPARQSTLGLPSYLPSVVFDVDLNMVYFDPPIAQGNTTHGWNTVPFADMKFYGVNPRAGTALPYPTYDFTNTTNGVFARAQ